MAPNREKIEALLEHSSESVYILTAEKNNTSEVVDFRIDAVSKSACSSLAMEPDQLVGQLICELFPENRTEGHFLRFKSAFETKQPVKAELIVGSGNPLSGVYLQKIIPTEEGVIVINDNISAEYKQRQSFKAVFDEIKFPLLVFEEDARVFMINKAALSILGLTKVEVIGKEFGKIRPQSEQKVRDRIKEVLTTERSHSYEDLSEFNGEMRHFSTLMHPINIIPSSENLVLAIVHDVTQIRTQNSILGAVFENSLHAIVIADDQGYYSKVNQAAADLFGYSKAELLKMKVSDLQSPTNPDLAKSYDSYVKAGAASGEIEILQPGSEQKIAHFQAIRIDHDLNLSILSDITEMKRTEAEKLDYEKKLLLGQKLESLGLLAGGIAHDFNNILMAILGYNDLAIAYVQQKDKVLQFTEEIRKSTRRAADLVKQMLDYSGQGNYTPETTDLDTLIEDIFEMLKVSIAKGIVLKVYNHNQQLLVEGDVSQLQQIVMNLVINASDAIGKKGGIITVATGKIHCYQEYIENASYARIDSSIKEGMYAYFEISDTGPGISKENASRIFDPFFSTKDTGRGLGLAAIQGIIKAHAGFIKMDTRQNRGTTFKVHLPLSDGSIPLKENQKDTDKVKHYEGTILLVDDEEEVRSVCRHFLETIGFHVELATDGYEAIEMFKSNLHKYSCILLDITMPYMNGLQVFKEMRKLNSEVKVIFSSGYNKQPEVQKLINRAEASFIQKPFGLAELITKINEIPILSKED